MPAPPPQPGTAFGRVKAVAAWAAAAAVASLGLGACGGGADPAAQQDVLAMGEAAYANHCMVCHGPQGAGTVQGPPLVHVVYEPSHHSDESFRRAVRQGVTPHHWAFGPMPPVLGVDDDELEAIIAYVRAVQREAGIH